ncbi:DUF1801 domain-containing protein [Dyadobacter sp. CY326]|uniref:DUF1801 domain-containing protein n=1 Tax=Dyadobacter sp. CY326 TaxID=2907300 RepID=UPI001F306346|nr:DUF1801 domain-containing protein [Dyadobacter sp. CY326]MCE7068162.1 DUF1801 domain-containing protein [Dyadobacter sp. CY326]
MPLNHDVTTFLDELNHPLRKEIEALRKIILQADSRLTENIKWNGPNYSVGTEDRITMKIQPPKQIQLVFHRGAKVKEQPKENLINEDYGLLVWKTTDRALASFTSLDAIEASTNSLTKIVREWLIQSIA